MWYLSVRKTPPGTPKASRKGHRASRKAYFGCQVRALRPKQPREAGLVLRIRAALFRAGWTLVEKTHGNAFQAGFPDLFVARPGARGGDVRWVEVKTPTGRLTRAQRIRFAQWEEAGVGVWVLSSPLEIGLLDREANWRSWA